MAMSFRLIASNCMFHIERAHVPVAEAAAAQTAAVLRFAITATVMAAPARTACPQKRFRYSYPPL